MKRNRNSMGYKIRMWWYRLTFGDIKKMGFEIGNGLSLTFALIALFILIFIAPALFH